jgi:hypothetical protein
LAVDGILETRAPDLSGPESAEDRRPVALRWHALWTRSHCERLVHDQLVAKGFQLVLPEVDVWSSRAGIRRLISAPMFPSWSSARRTAP